MKANDLWSFHKTQEEAYAEGNKLKENGVIKTFRVEHHGEEKFALFVYKRRIPY